MSDEFLTNVIVTVLATFTLIGFCVVVALPIFLYRGKQ